MVLHNRINSFFVGNLAILDFYARAKDRYFHIDMIMLNIVNRFSRNKIDFPYLIRWIYDVSIA